MTALRTAHFLPDELSTRFQRLAAIRARDSEQHKNWPSGSKHNGNPQNSPAPILLYVCHQIKRKNRQQSQRVRCRPTDCLCYATIFRFRRR